MHATRASNKRTRTERRARRSWPSKPPLRGQGCSCGIDRVPRLPTWRDDGRAHSRWSGAVAPLRATVSRSIAPRSTGVRRAGDLTRGFQCARVFRTEMVSVNCTHRERRLSRRYRTHVQAGSEECRRGPRRCCKSRATARGAVQSLDAAPAYGTHSRFALPKVFADIPTGSGDLLQRRPDHRGERRRRLSRQCRQLLTVIEQRALRGCDIPAGDRLRQAFW